MMSIDLNNYPLVPIFLGSLGVIVAASEIGRWLGARAGTRGEENVLTLEAAVLGLLADLRRYSHDSGSRQAAHWFHTSQPTTYDRYCHKAEGHAGQDWRVVQKSFFGRPKSETSSWRCCGSEPPNAA